MRHVLSVLEGRGIDGSITYQPPEPAKEEGDEEAGSKIKVDDASFGPEYGGESFESFGGSRGGHEGGKKSTKKPKKKKSKKKKEEEEPEEPELKVIEDKEKRIKNNIYWKFYREVINLKNIRRLYHPFQIF